MTLLHRLLPALAGLAALLAAAPARAEQVDWRADEDMFVRAMNGDEPTPEDQRRARQLLRDWRLSEQANPSPGGYRTEEMFRCMAEGRRLPPELAQRAREMHRDYFTPEGRERRQVRLGGSSGNRFNRPKSAGGTPPPAETRTIDLLMPGLLVLIVIGGVIVTAVAGRRRPLDGGI